MSDHPRTTTVLRRFESRLAEAASDLADVRRWLEDHADDLTDAEVHSVSLDDGTVDTMKAGVALRVQIHCHNPQALARVTRTLIRGAGHAVVAKDLEEVDALDGESWIAARVFRRFGLVVIEAWARSECTVEQRPVPGGYETRTICPPLLSLAAA